MGKITLKTIADKCGVSKGLVSLALSRGYGVSAKKRTEIVIAAIQLGYDFNRLKKHRDDDQGRLIVVLVKKIDLQIDRFWPQIIKGIESEADSIHCHIAVKSWSEDTDFEAFIPEMVDAQCIGILIVSEIPPVLFTHLTLSRIPMVLIDGKQMVDDQIDSVSVNNYAASYKATEYLIRRGCQNLVFVGDVLHAYSFNQRYLGFADCLRDHPKVAHESLIGPATASDGPDCFDWGALRNHMRQCPSAVYVCANDFIAEFVYRFAAELGRVIPNEVGVLGFDDILSAGMMTPPLSTVAVPKKELGEKAVQVLLDRITERNAPYSRTTLMALPVVRGSIRFPHS